MTNTNNARASLRKTNVFVATLLIFTLIIAGSPVAAASLLSTSERVSAATTLTFISEADAEVQEANPNTNYGNLTTILVDGATDPNVDGYLRFTVSGVSGPVQSAKLRLYDATNASTNGPAVYGTSNSWTETGITWNTRPARTSAAVDNAGQIALQTWVEYNVTTLVTGNGTYSFDLGADSTDGTTFLTREGSNPPQLMLTLGTGASPTAVSSPTPTSVKILTATPTAGKSA